MEEVEPLGVRHQGLWPYRAVFVYGSPSPFVIAHGEGFIEHERESVTSWHIDKVDEDYLRYQRRRRMAMAEMVSLKVGKEELLVVERAARLAGVPRGRFIRVAAVEAARRLLTGENIQPRRQRAEGEKPDR